MHCEAALPASSAPSPEPSLTSKYNLPYVSRSCQDEGVLHVEPLTPDSFAAELRDTLLCFVLVGPASAHAFCSRYDFGPWPLLPGVATLPPGVLQVLLFAQTRLRPYPTLPELPACRAPPL